MDVFHTFDLQNQETIIPWQFLYWLVTSWKYIHPNKIEKDSFFQKLLLDGDWVHLEYSSISESGSNQSRMWS